MKPSLKPLGEITLIKCVIPFKLPSLNDYVDLCRENRYKAASFKKKLENDISLFLQFPKIEEPVTIDFIWYEDNRRRDYDNIAFAKKFILDAMVKSGKIQDDNRRFVKGFTDVFKYSQNAKVEIYIYKFIDSYLFDAKGAKNESM